MSEGDALLRVRTTVSAWPGRTGLRLAGRIPSGAEGILARVVDARGRPFVLKIGAPTRIAAELMALQALRGPGVVRVEDAWTEAGALLLEEVRPGTPLSEVEDEEAARLLFSTALKRLRGRALVGTFPSLVRWTAALTTFSERLVRTRHARATLIDRWRAAAGKLVATAPASALLHGDLHDGNLLRQDGDGYIAIDPKGVVGEAAYETAPFLMNRWTRRADLPGSAMVLGAETLASDLGLAPARVLSWAGTHTALSLCWSWEDDRRVPEEDDPRWRLLDRLEAEVRPFGL